MIPEWFAGSFPGRIPGPFRTIAERLAGRFPRKFEDHSQEDLMATFQDKLQGHSQDHFRAIGWLFSKAIPGRFQDDLRAVLQGYSN